MPIELTAIATINRGAAMKVLVAAVVEAFVNAKLERTDVDGAVWAPRNRKVPQLCEGLSKRVHQALTAALADAAGATLGDMKFVALVFHSVRAKAIRAVLEPGARAKMVVRLREELLVVSQGCAAKSNGQLFRDAHNLGTLRGR